MVLLIKEGQLPVMVQRQETAQANRSVLIKYDAIIGKGFEKIFLDYAEKNPGCVARKELDGLSVLPLGITP